MTKKQFNNLVRECRANTCSTCGLIPQCFELERRGVKSPFTRKWSDYTRDAQELIFATPNYYDLPLEEQARNIFLSTGRLLTR